MVTRPPIKVSSPYVKRVIPYSQALRSAAQDAFAVRLRILNYREMKTWFKKKGYKYEFLDTCTNC